jgi:hypothetical protein
MSESSHVQTAIEAIERFFLDFIGFIVPGMVFLVGFPTACGRSSIVLGTLELFPPNSEGTGVIFVIAAYAVGHWLYQTGNLVVLRMLERSCFKGVFRRVIPRLKTEEELAQEISDSEPYKTVRGASSSKSSTESVHETRSVALTIAKEHENKVYRFMFTALLYLGLATALWFLALVTLIHAAEKLCQMELRISTFGWSLWEALPVPILVAILLFLASLPLLNGRYEFHSRAMRVPFPIAAALLREKAAPTTPPAT